MNNYIVVDRSKIEEKIKEFSIKKNTFYKEITFLEDILTNSTPLSPIIEEAFLAARDYKPNFLLTEEELEHFDLGGAIPKKYLRFEDYLEQLKLGI